MRPAAVHSLTRTREGLRTRVTDDVIHGRHGAAFTGE